MHVAVSCCSLKERRGIFVSHCNYSMPSAMKGDLSLMQGQRGVHTRPDPKVRVDMAVPWIVMAVSYSPETMQAIHRFHGFLTMQLYLASSVFQNDSPSAKR